MRIGMPHVRDGGSFTLTTGIVGREVIATGAAFRRSVEGIETGRVYTAD